MLSLLIQVALLQAPPLPNECPWSLLRQLRAGDSSTQAAQRLAENAQAEELLSTLRPHLKRASRDELLLFVRESEALQRFDLVMEATEDLPPSSELRDAWMARGRVFASRGSWREADLLLKEVAEHPELEKSMAGLYGVLAFAHHRAERFNDAARLSIAHTWQLLHDSVDPHRSTAALPSQALKMLERFERAGDGLTGAQHLSELCDALEHAIAASSAKAPSLEHLQRAALSRMRDPQGVSASHRMEWLNWTLNGAATSDERWWTEAALYAISDSAQSLNLTRETTEWSQWCERALMRHELREHETLYAALKQLSLRAENRAEHLRWLSERDVSKGPAVTLLCATPGSLPERTQRVLAELKREQPGAAVEVRVPRRGDPAARFSPQWTLRDSAGVARAVIVGDGPTSTQALISELRRAG